MSKRIPALLCAVILAVLLAACQTGPAAPTSSAASESTSSVQEASSSAAEKPTPAPTPTPEVSAPAPTPAPEVSAPAETSSGEKLPEANTEDAAFTELFGANSIDEAFFTESEDAATSIQMMNLYNKYINIWDAQVGTLYRALLGSVSGNNKEALKNGQEAWISATPGALEEIRAGAAGAGSNASVSVAAETMEYYRARAMELASIHYQLYGDIGFD